MRTILALVLAGGLVLSGPAVFAKGGKGGGGDKGAKNTEQRKERKEEKKAFKDKQKTERKEFKQSLKEKSPEERKQAMQQFNQQQLAEKKAFYAERNAENMAMLKERLTKNPKLSDAQRTEILSHFQAQQNENVAYNETSQKKITEFMGKIGADQTMTPEQRKTAIQEFYSGLKKERQAFQQQQKQENQSFRKTVKPATDAGATGASAETPTQSMTPADSGIPDATTP